MTHKNSIFFFAIAIFFIIFIVLGIPYMTIGFDSDCFGLVFLSSQIKSFNDLLVHLFKPIQSCYVALNEQVCYQPDGFLTYFRPLMTLSHYICYQLFGFTPYTYHLINVGLHALTTSLVFVIFSSFISLSSSFMLSLLFAFFPALTPAYVGVTSHVVPTYVFSALIVLTYKKFLETNCMRWQLISALCFTLSLLCYEIMIVFPFILVVFLLMFNYDKIFYRSYLFVVAFFGYLAARFFLLGAPAAHEQKILNFTSLPHKIFFNWHQAIKPFWGLQTISKPIVIGVTLIFLTLLLSAFFYAPHRRKKFIFYTISFFLLCWPISLVTADPRYFYPAIPFFILILYEIVLHFFSNLLLLSFALLISWSIWHDTNALRTRSFVTHARDRAFQGLAEYYGHIPDLRLIMIGTLHCYNHDTLFMQQGMTQAARLFFNNQNLEAYHITQAKIYSHNQTQRSFLIKQLNNGFRFISPEPEKLFFMIPHSWNEETPVPFSMGTIIVHKKSDSWKASDISFLFDAQWLHKADLTKTKFVTFDLKLWSFVELNLDE